MNIRDARLRLIEGFSRLRLSARRALAQDVETACVADGLCEDREAARPRSHPLAITPLVLARADAAAAAALAACVCRFHAIVPSLYRADAAGLRALCPLEPAAAAWLSACGACASRKILIRIDAGLTAEGPVLFETNAVGAAGLFNHTVAAGVLRRTVFPRLAPEAAAAWPEPQNLLDGFARWLRDGMGRRPRVGFLDAPPFSPGDQEMPAIAAWLRRAGWRAAYGSPEDLRCRGRGARLAGRSIDLVYRHVAFRFLGEPAAPPLAALLRLSREGRALPGPAAEFDHKGLLECLSSPAFERFLSRSDARLLRGRVPWTRVVFERRTDSPRGRIVDLPELLLRDRQRWLLKPNRGYGGDGVILGALASPGAWAAALDRALRSPGSWVAQERRKTRRELMIFLRRGRWRAADCGAVLGVFFAGEGRRGRLLGFHGRVAPGPIVNVGRGGALACVVADSRLEI